MIRSIYLFILLALFAIGGVWLADHPGNVSIRWDNYVVETNVIVLVALALIFAALLTLSYQIFMWLRNGPDRLGGAFAARRRGKGLEALSNGMVAIAAGDANEARRAAIEAEKHLAGEPMTLLLAAQAAELNEDDRAARIYYDRMTERADTEFLGLRGLISRAKAENDADKTLEHAKRADALKPGTEWVLKELFELYLKARNYDEAVTTLDRMARGKKAKGVKVKRLHAVIGYERAVTLLEAGEKERAKTLVIAAHEQDPAFVPASILCIRLMDAGRKLDKVIADAWRHSPHPDIASATQVLVPNELPKDWYNRAVKVFGSIQPEHRETALVLAKASLGASEWGQARKYLNQAAKADPSSSIYRLLADLDEKANADAIAARKWILKSAEAPQDPLWICGSCGRQEISWSAHCPSCDSFDSFSWRKADRGSESHDVLGAEVVQEIEAPA